MVGKRNEEIDFIRGIAIILVVVGHYISGIYDVENYNANIIFKICYSFHMPLFIYISGYLAGKTSAYSLEWIRKNFERIMIPYIVWTILHCLVFKENIIRTLFVSPAYWFLINLFVYHGITFISDSLKRKYVEPMVYCAVALFYLVFKDANLVIKNVVMFFPFYIFGRIVAKKKLEERIYKIGKHAILIYPVLMIFYTYKEYDKYGNALAGVLHINAKVIKLIMLGYNHYVVAIWGILFVLSFANIINTNWKGIRPIIYFGKTTLPIYLLHDFFFRNWFKENLNGVGMILLAVIAPCVIYETISYCNKSVAKFLFGSFHKIKMK